MGSSTTDRVKGRIKEAVEDVIDKAKELLGSGKKGKDDE